jgi:hypothetical protein
VHHGDSVDFGHAQQAITITHMLLPGGTRPLEACFSKALRGRIPPDQVPERLKCSDHLVRDEYQCIAGGLGNCSSPASAAKQRDGRSDIRLAFALQYTSS